MALVQHDWCPSTKGTHGLSADVHKGDDVKRGPQREGGPAKAACRDVATSQGSPATMEEKGLECILPHSPWEEPPC